MTQERVSRTDRRPGEESHAKAIQAVEDALRNRHDIARIDKVTASWTGAGDWSVVVEGVLVDEEGDG